MAIATLTNTSGLTLNTPQTGGYGISPDAVGGNIARPLPFPFDRNGALADGNDLVLPVRERDLVVRQQAQQPSLPADELQELVQKGWVEVEFAADATVTAGLTPTAPDVEDAFVKAFDT